MIAWFNCWSDCLRLRNLKLVEWFQDGRRVAMIHRNFETCIKILQVFLQISLRIIRFHRIPWKCHWRWTWPALDRDDALR